jgi:hypothetical protein
MMGGALGLAILASLAASRTETLLASGEGQLAALTGGYHIALLVGAAFAAEAAMLSAVLLRAAPSMGLTARLSKSRRSGSPRRHEATHA